MRPLVIDSFAGGARSSVQRVVPHVVLAAKISCERCYSTAQRLFILLQHPVCFNGETRQILTAGSILERQREQLFALGQALDIIHDHVGDLRPRLPLTLHYEPFAESGACVPTRAAVIHLSGGSASLLLPASAWSFSPPALAKQLGRRRTDRRNPARCRLHGRLRAAAAGVRCAMALVTPHVTNATPNWPGSRQTTLQRILAGRGPNVRSRSSGKSASDGTSNRAPPNDTSWRLQREIPTESTVETVPSSGPCGPVSDIESSTINPLSSKSSLHTHSRTAQMLWIRRISIDGTIDGRVCTRTIRQLRSRLIATALLDAFARQDGLQAIGDMARFWRAEHPGRDNFSGVLVRWTPVQDMEALAAGRAA